MKHLAGLGLKGCLGGLALVAAAFNARAEPLLLAQSLPLTGPDASVARELDAGRRACLDAVNARGGVAGNRLGLLTVDDHGQPEQALQALRQWQERDHPVLLFGPMGAAVNEAMLPAAAKAGLVVVGPQGGDVGSRQARGAEASTAILLTPNQSIEAAGLVRHVKALGLRRVAVLVAKGSAGQSALLAFEEALSVEGMPPIGMATLRADGADAAAGVQSLLAMAPQAVLLATTGAATVAALSAMDKARHDGVKPLQIYAMSSSLTPSELRPIGQQAQGLTMTSVLPWYGDARVPVANHFRQAAQSAGLTPGYVAFEGCLSVMAAAELLAKTPGVPSPATVLKAARSAPVVDLGGYAVDLRPGADRATGTVDLLYVGPGGRLLR